MPKSGICDTQAANRVLLDALKIPEGVEMYMQLPDYYDFHGFDLPSKADLSAISKRIYEGFAKPSWPTLKHHLFIAHIQKKSFKAIMGICSQDKKGGFRHERLARRAAKIHISRTPNGLAEMDFVDGGEAATSLHIRDTSRRCPMAAFVGDKKELFLGQRV